jgi:hypothetical protein
MLLTLKAINAELARRGYTALLAKGDGYFYFESGEAAEWLDRTVNVPTISSLRLAVEPRCAGGGTVGSRLLLASVAAAWQ